MMRIFVSLNHYQDYLDNRLGSFPTSETICYASLRRWIDSDHALTFQPMVEALSEISQVDAVDWTYSNCEQLQRLWEPEQDYRKSRTNDSLEEILLEQAKQFQPDVLLCIGLALPPSNNFISEVRAAIPTLRLIVGWDGRVMHRAELFQGMDGVLTCHPPSVPYYESQGIKCGLLPFCYDERLIDLLAPEQRESRVLFTGSIMIASDGHNARLRLIAELCGLPEFAPHLAIKGLRNWKVWAGMAKRGDWDLMSFLLRLYRKNGPVCYGMEMHRLIANSLITVNSHIDAAGDWAGNVRMFEATGAGSCLVTDAKSNLADFFEPGAEVAVYTSAPECKEMCRWLLDHPLEAERIAENGRKRIKKSHTAKARAIDLFNLLTKWIQ